ncbi:hypothetical protein GCM10027214_36320 [Stenotrophomonas tumulicola]
MSPAREGIQRQRGMAPLYPVMTGRARQRRQAPSRMSPARGGIQRQRGMAPLYPVVTGHARQPGYNNPSRFTDR